MINLGRMLIVALFFSGLLHGCGIYGPPPGEGRMAESYYKKAEPIISALSEYFLKYQAYPEDLYSLSPEFIDEIDWPQNMYEGSGNSYELWFNYQGPGMNTCIYEPGKDWKCSGLI